jgi:hypothetical protein
MARAAIAHNSMARESAAHTQDSAREHESARERATRLAAVRPPTTPHPHPHPKPINVNLNSVQYSGAEMHSFSHCFNRSLAGPADCFGHATKAPVNTATGVPIG